MGRSGLSSKRKHSKKRSIKVSSEGRRKKRIRRNKSKKLRRHDDSFSSYSDDESTSSSLGSSSSSEGEYRSRRVRSRARDEVKGRRKHTRRRSLSEESSRDSPCVKKRKESKTKDDFEMRKKKKKSKKKKVRRYSYSSSTSNDSASCSTCGDGDNSSDEGVALGRLRVRSREKKKDHRYSVKGRNVHRKNKSRPRSSSPSKLSNSYDDDSIEKVVVENNSRRLKSVITVAIRSEEEEEGNNMNKDDHELKEEIVYDHDDYPSSKSNDSNDGENKKEPLDNSIVSSEKMVANVIEEDKKSVDSQEKDGNAYGKLGSEVDNLELILRQKALENLSKFRGGIQTKAKVPVDNHKSNQSKPPAPDPQPVIQRSRFTWRRHPSASTGKEEKASTHSVSDSGGSQAPAPKLPNTILSSMSRVANKGPYGSSKTVVNTFNTGTPDAQKSPSVLETPSCGSSEKVDSKEGLTETKDNSQFEQKTMSVMRGGEMVQVSYKVYIPKKTPALARRQLKR